MHKLPGASGTKVDAPAKYPPSRVQFCAPKFLAQYWNSGVCPGGQVAIAFRSIVPPTLPRKVFTGNASVTAVHGFALRSCATSLVSPSPVASRSPSSAHAPIATMLTMPNAAPRHRIIVGEDNAEY